MCSNIKHAAIDFKLIKLQSYILLQLKTEIKVILYTYNYIYSSITVTINSKQTEININLQSSVNLKSSLQSIDFNTR